MSDRLEEDRRETAGWRACVGFFAGELADEDGLGPELFRFLLASDWSFAAATTVFGVSAAFAIPLFHQRQSYVSG